MIQLPGDSEENRGVRTCRSPCVRQRFRPSDPPGVWQRSSSTTTAKKHKNKLLTSSTVAMGTGRSGTGVDRWGGGSAITPPPRGAAAQNQPDSLTSRPRRRPPSLFCHPCYTCASPQVQLRSGRRHRHRRHTAVHMLAFTLAAIYAKVSREVS